MRGDRGLFLENDDFVSLKVLSWSGFVVLLLQVRQRAEFVSKVLMAYCVSNRVKLCGAICEKDKLIRLDTATMSQKYL